MSIYYIVPEIKVYQPSNKDAFCLGVQIGKLVLKLCDLVINVDICRILEVCIAKRFKELSCKLVEEISWFVLVDTR